MRLHTVLVSALLLTTTASGGYGQAAAPLQRIESPKLRADVAVSGDIVRIGDLVENAGAASDIAIYRAPDLGTTGKLKVADILATLRTHHVIGVDTQQFREIAVTRLTRTIDASDIERQIAQTLAHRNGLGNAADIMLTPDGEIRTLKLDAAHANVMTPVMMRFDSRNGRYDITFTIATDSGAAPTRLRYTGTAVETVEAIVINRTMNRGDVIKASDLMTERRPKAEVGLDNTTLSAALGMQINRSLRAGQAIRTTDLSKPNLIERDQPVTLTYQSAGIYLTIRGKAVEAGTEGDNVNVMNLQSKRIVTGTVIGRGQVAVSAPVIQRPPVAEATTAAPVDVSSAPSAIKIASIPERTAPARNAE